MNLFKKNLQDASDGIYQIVCVSKCCVSRGQRLSGIRGEGLDTWMLNPPIKRTNVKI